MCRLLGAVASKQGTDVTALFKEQPDGDLMRTGSPRIQRFSPLTTPAWSDAARCT
jgi:hypothetical protein